MFEKKTNAGSKSKPRNVETFPTAKESIEGVKMALRVLRECQSLVINNGVGSFGEFSNMCLASLGNLLKTLLQDNYVVRICIYIYTHIYIYMYV